MNQKKTHLSKKTIIGAISLMVFYGFVFISFAEAESPSIKVCKVAISAEGAVVDGSLSPSSTFTISGITPSPETSQGAPAGAFGSHVFTVPLALDSDLFGGDSINDASCFTFGDLLIGNGGYYYGEEAITGSGWSTPKYNDQFVTTVASFTDFYSYDGNLFDGDIENDGSRNTDADGHILLTEERPNRILVILNQLLNPPAPITQCNDGTDNDGDELVDLNDSGCTDVSDNDEINIVLTQCNDTIDNDADELTDLSDAGCTDATDNDETDPVATPPPSPELVSPPPSGGSGGGGSNSVGNGSPFLISQFIGAPASVANAGGGQVLGATSIIPDGEVLGENCSPYLNEYIKYGAKNNPEEVKKLQIFMNKHFSLDLPLSGFYGSLTRDAVNQFQIKYSNEVLLPWVNYGLPDGKTPTGYVFKTTKRWINMIECSALNLPVPQLP